MKYINNKIVYEVGDWVKYTNRDFQTVAPIIRVSDFIHLDTSIAGKSVIWSSERFEPATQKEIDEAIKEKEIKVGEYIVNFDFAPNEWIRVGCQTVSKDLFLKIGKKAGWL